MAGEDVEELVAAVLKRQKIPRQDHDDYAQIARLAAWQATGTFDPSRDVELRTHVYTKARFAVIDAQRVELGRNGQKPTLVELAEPPACYDPAIELPPVPKRTCGYCAAALPATTEHFASSKGRLDTRCLECRRVFSRLYNLRKRRNVLRERQAELVRPLADVEREHIEFAVTMVGDISRTAELLGIGKATLYRKLAEYAKLPALAVNTPARNNQFGARHAVDECELELRKRERDWRDRKNSG